MPDQLRSPVHPDDVALHLKKASTGRRLVRLRPSIGGDIEGILVELQPDGGPIVIADLTPDGARDLERSHETEIDYVTDGVEFSLVTKFVDALPMGGKLRFAPSTTLFRSQRRQWYRVLINDGSVVSFGNRTRTVVDVGGGGVCIELVPGEDADLKPNLEIRPFSVFLPGEQAIETVAAIRHVREVHLPQTSLRAGIELTRLSDFVRDRLVRCVARRERELLGRRQHPRINVPTGSLALVCRDGGRPRVRRLLDVGSGGARFHMEPTTDADLVAGVKLASVELRMRGFEPLAMSAVVARIRKDPEEISVGIEFKEITAADRDTLARYARAAAWGTPLPTR